MRTYRNTCGRYGMAVAATLCLTFVASKDAGAQAKTRRLEPRALVETVVDSLKLELDLRMEAGGASELREVMARSMIPAALRLASGVG